MVTRGEGGRSMARRADELRTRYEDGAVETSRPGASHYYQQIAPGLTLGYVRRGHAAGHVATPRTRVCRAPTPYRTIGAADDVGTADGRDVLTHARRCVAGAPAPCPQAPRRSPCGARWMPTSLALAGRSSHAGEARQRVEEHILPTLGRVRVDRLTKAPDRGLARGLVKADDPDDGDAPAAARRLRRTRVLTILKAALNEAFADGRTALRAMRHGGA